MSFTVRRAIFALVVVAMAAYTVVALIADGPGFFTRPFTDSTSSSLIVTDLLIELVLISVAIFFDARRRDRNPWGWIVVTMLLGAVGSLGYLLARSFDPDAPPLFALPAARAAARTDQERAG
jgi:RsiW-degrading membrane proteinase PrsW (M82 family)